MTKDPAAERELAPMNELVAALAQAHADFPVIDKTQTATVRIAESKGGGSYNYKYADLGDVLAKVRPVLAANGLALIQHTRRDEGKIVLVTELRHTGGGIIDSELEIAADTGIPQQFGASLTYLRRYELVTLLGIAAEEDRDAQDVDPVRRNGGQPAPAPLPDWARDTTDERRAELVTAAIELGLERENAARILKAAVDKFGAVPNAVVIVAKWLAASTPDAIARREADAAAKAAEAPDPPAPEPAADPTSDERQAARPSGPPGDAGLTEEEAKRLEEERAQDAADVGEQAQAAEDPLPPSSVDPPPDLDAVNFNDVNDRDRLEAVYRTLGCTCRNPLAYDDVTLDKLTAEEAKEEALIDDRCPIKTHGIPF